MSDPVYRELARKLDSIPPGFPATESGVELELLSRFYTPKQARIISVMRLTYETAAEIAARAAVDSRAAFDILNGAARKGLVRARLGEQEPTFALNPQRGGLIGYSYKEILLGAIDHTPILSHLENHVEFLCGDLHSIGLRYKDIGYAARQATGDSHHGSHGSHEH